MLLGRKWASSYDVHVVLTCKGAEELRGWAGDRLRRVLERRRLVVRERLGQHEKVGLLRGRFCDERDELLALLGCGRALLRSEVRGGEPRQPLGGRGRGAELHLRPNADL